MLNADAILDSLDFSCEAMRPIAAPAGRMVRAGENCGPRQGARRVRGRDLGRGGGMNLPQAKRLVQAALPAYLTEGQSPVTVTVGTQWVLGRGVRWVARAHDAGSSEPCAVGVALTRSEALERMVEDSKWWARMGVAS